MTWLPGWLIVWAALQGRSDQAAGARARSRPAPSPSPINPCLTPPAQEAALEGERLRCAGVCVSQARGVVPGYGQVKVPVAFAPTLDGALRG